MISRRAPEFLGDAVDGVGWTIIKKISPKGRRDPYYAYLASLPEGHVPSIPISVPGAAEVNHGVVFRHLGYDFGKSGRVDTALYSALNHVLFNPVLPYDLYALREKPDAMKGNAHRLARRADLELRNGARVLDKSFAPQPIGISK